MLACEAFAGVLDGDAALVGDADFFAGDAAAFAGVTLAAFLGAGVAGFGVAAFDAGVAALAGVAVLAGVAAALAGVTPLAGVALFGFGVAAFAGVAAGVLGFGVVALLADLGLAALVGDCLAGVAALAGDAALAGLADLDGVLATIVKGVGRKRVTYANATTRINIEEPAPTSTFPGQKAVQWNQRLRPFSVLRLCLSGSFFLCQSVMPTRIARLVLLARRLGAARLARLRSLRRCLRRRRRLGGRR